MEEKDIVPQNALQRFRKAVPMLYAIVLLAMFIMVILNIALKDSYGADYGLKGFVPMNADWYTTQGELFEVAEIDALRQESSEYISIFHQLPAEIGREDSIVFRSKNCLVRVLIDGEEIYATDVAEAPFYNHSPGTRWNVITLDNATPGCTIELQVKQAYEDGRAKVDNFYFGDRGAILLHLIDSKLFGCIISLLILFVGIVFMASWVVLNWRRNPKDNSLLWLAVFAFFAALWCLLETNLLQLFSQNLRLIQVVDNMMLVLAGLPLFLYMDSTYQVFRWKIVRWLCGANVLYLLLSTASQFLGFWDYHQTLNGAISTYGIVIVILLICLWRQRGQAQKFPNKSTQFFASLQQVGIWLLGLGLLVDLVRYLTSDVLDRAFVIRLGLLGFIICFGAGNIFQMIQLVKRGLESELISQLAYLDGLTRVGNRTAYTEHLQRLEKELPQDSLAIAMFDINDLKWVNDTLGHKAGDALILSSATLLLESFGQQWQVYRIGGDEFVALGHGDGIHAQYESALALFDTQLAALNQDPQRGYPIVIAQGVAFSPVITHKSIAETEHQADLNMYQNKFQLKQSKGAGL